MAAADSAVRVGFIGAGQMATALGRGLVAGGFTTAANLCACDPIVTARERFAVETGGGTFPDAAQVVTESDLVVLAVKPQHMSEVLDEIKGRLTDAQIIVSIAAGITIQTLTAALGATRRIVRVMPNTPCLVGAGACGYALGGQATQDDSQLVRRLLATVGIAVEVSEPLLDAVTGLSGSGPAYVYLIIEALSDGGVRMGLPRSVATQLAAQTVLGAARMVLETGQHPGPLKDAVTSPGGTTIAGLHALERGGLRGCLMNAVEAATQRAQELGHAR